MALTADLVPDLSAYDARDYRRFVSAHLQLLTGLCSLAMKSVGDAIRQFVTLPFVTTELRSEEDFRAHVGPLVENRKSEAAATLDRLLSSWVAINHGNAIVSTYGTNFKYYFPHWLDPFTGRKFILCSKAQW